jgi:hypothetical protein
VVGVEFRQGKFELHNSVFAKGEFKRNPNRRHISVEIEVDGFSTHKYSTAVNLALDKWRDAVVRDGSISGFEINTNPANGDKFLEHMKELCDGLAAIDALCSPACGLHVHVNCKGMPLLDKQGKMLLDESGNPVFDAKDAFTHYDLRRVVDLYAKVEKAMFGLCHPLRVTSRYAVPCGSYYSTKDISPKMFRQRLVSQLYRNGKALPDGVKIKLKKHEGRIQGNDLKNKKQHKYQEVRYKALNLHSYFMRGTVEFRHHEGTADYNTITNWALICATVVDRASKMTDNDIKALPSVSKDALRAILPDNLRRYAEETWQKHDREPARVKKTFEDTWANLPNNDRLQEVVRQERANLQEQMRESHRSAMAAMDEAELVTMEVEPTVFGTSEPVLIGRAPLEEFYTNYVAAQRPRLHPDEMNEVSLDDIRSL